jgi:hypothetical protein
MVIKMHTNSTCSINIHSLVTRCSAADKLVLRRATVLRCDTLGMSLFPRAPVRYGNSTGPFPEGQKLLSQEQSFTLYK